MNSVSDRWSSSISRVSIPRVVVPRLDCPSRRWMTLTARSRVRAQVRAGAAAGAERTAGCGLVLDHVEQQPTGSLMRSSVGRRYSDPRVSHSGLAALAAMVPVASVLRWSD
jgi:hypothetical protein